MALVVIDEDDANYMFRKLAGKFDIRTLEIILMDKTHDMVFGSQGQDLHTERRTIQTITSYTHLGVTLTAERKDVTGIQSKISKCKTIIRQLHLVLWNTNLSNKTKNRIHKTFIESIVTYGSKV